MIESLIVGGAGAVAMWQFFGGKGPIPTAFSRLIDAVTDCYFTIPNEVSRSKVAAEVRRADVQSATEVRILEANADHALKLFEKQAVDERARAWDELKASRQQRNRERILQEAADELKGTPDSELKGGRVDPDWTAQFFDHAQDVSSEEMQRLWARLLAGEVKRPGSFSRRTLDVVRKLSKEDGELFARICSFIWKEANDARWVLTSNKWTKPDAKSIQLTFEALDRLAECGLIVFDRLPTTVMVNAIGVFTLDYYGSWFTFRPAEGKTKEGLPLGPCSLTSVGKELARVATGERNEAYLAAILDVYRTDGWEVTPILPPRL